LDWNRRNNPGLGVRRKVGHSLGDRMHVTPAIVPGTSMVVIGGRLFTPGTRLTFERLRGLGTIFCRTEDGTLVSVNQREVRQFPSNQKGEED
jgi:hypothetical protein